MNPGDLPSLEELAELLPQYRFEHLLAEGGMGAVYRAEQISLGRPVAIKILPRSLSADPDYRDQFKSEARLMGSLTHPHIVDIHDFGEAGQVLYIVMELLEGTNLHVQMRTEPLRQQDVVRIFTQVCDALAAAHRKGVVHRDVKPENIFLEDGLRAKLGDFGIARQHRTDIESGVTPPEDTVNGVRLGTPEYAAPELFDFDKHIDHRADIFSLGVVLYEVLTGVRPTGAFIAPSKRKTSLDRRFDVVVIRAMQFEPADRYESAEEMKRELLKVVSPAIQPAAQHPAQRRKTPTGRSGARQAAAASLPAAAGVAGEEPFPRTSSRRQSRRKSPALLWSGIGVAAAVAVIGGSMLRGGGKDAPKNSAGDTPDAGSAPDSVFTSSGTPVPHRTPVCPPAPAPHPVPASVTSTGSSRTQRAPSPLPEKLSFGGHTYQFIPSRLTWLEAKTDAESRGGCLACITSQAEYDALRAYLLPLIRQELDGVWLGASDADHEGEWKWVTGEPFTFKAWAPDAPSNGSDSNQGPQNYLYWQKQQKYGERQIGWNDVSANPQAPAGALIEWENAGPTPPPAEVARTPQAPEPVHPPVVPAPAGTDGTR